MRWVAGTAVVCALISCGGADGGRDSAISRAARPPKAEVEVTPAPLATRARLALDGDGLVLVDTASGSTRVIAFGAPETEAITAVASAVGAPRGRSTNLECGAGPLDFVAFERGLLVNVQKARFVGWTVRPERKRPLRTMSGIGLGSTRAELQHAYATAIAKSTIGMEFSAGGLQGVLASGAALARITDLWAGTNCVAR